MHRIAGIERVHRQHVAFRQLAHDGAPPHVISGEIGAVVLAIRGDFPDMREWHTHDDRHDQQQ
jgi:hypothetical protein